MQKLIALLLIMTLSCQFILCQDMTTREIKIITSNFLEKLQTKNQVVHNIMVSDFTDGKVAPTELGRFLAEEFSYHLSNDENISFLDRSRLEELLQEQGLVRDELIDPMSIVKLGKLKGMKYLLYGTIIASSERYTIYVKLIEVETQKIIVSSRGYISKIPSLPKHL